MQWPVLIAFKLNWLSAFFWGDHAQPILVAGLLLLIILQVRNYRWRILIPCSMLAMLGILLDWSLVTLGVLDFAQPGLPLYMLLLWGSFALLLPSLRIFPQPFLALLVSILGPLSYYLASTAQLFSFHSGVWQGLAILFPLWAVFAYLAHRLLENSDV
ncbi:MULTISPECIES: DUF2878 family protein [unclassified Agarivorans]|uniref:DUF2878 family protein n=1 Tax=unclassified Agarivorans TaxID=2636026 RepID=UPI003D7F11E6